MSQFITYWNYAWLISFILIFFRTDRDAMLKELFGYLFKPDFVMMILSTLIIYGILPFTIIHTIIKIFTKDE